MYKNFDTWNNEKKKIQERHLSARYFPGEIWWCKLGINIGTETDGKINFERPVIVIKFWNHTMVWILPLTSKEYSDAYHHKIVVAGKTSFVKLSQVRTISTKRLLRKLGKIPYLDVIAIKRKIIHFLACETPRASRGVSRRA